MGEWVLLAVAIFLGLVLALIIPPPSGRVCGCCWAPLKRRGGCPNSCRVDPIDPKACAVHGR